MLFKKISILLFFVYLQTTITFAEERNITFVLSAKNLPSNQHDDYSKIDPFVKVYESTPDKAELNSIGKTEALFDDENPEWIEVFWLVYKSGTSQKLRLEMKDRDVLKQDDAIGGAEVDLDDYVSKGENITVEIKGVSGATLTIQKTNPIRFKLSARNLPKNDKPPTIFQAFTSDEGESDPYVKCYFRRGIGGQDKKYATTSTIDNVVNADWNDVIEFGNYQPGTDQYWRFKVKDSDSTSKDDDVGEVVLQIDPFVKEKVAKELKLESTDGGSDTGAILTVTPL